jgi:hypothetical protein
MLELLPLFLRELAIGSVGRLVVDFVSVLVVTVGVAARGSIGAVAVDVGIVAAVSA